jgi:hypothetical protein
MALSGHEAAVYPLLRTALESACYALVITRKPELAATWSARHDGDAERKASRRAFASAVSDAADFVSCWQQGLGAYVLELYDANIDFGAHPNTRSVMDHVHEMPADQEQEGFGLGSIYPGNSLEVFRALVAAIESARGISMVLTCCQPSISEKVVHAVQALEKRQDELFPSVAEGSS